MSSDGASMGVNADRALETILGGEEQPAKEEQKTPAAMEAEIRAQGFENLSYGTCATATARLILEAYDKYPQLKALPSEQEYLRDATGKMLWPAVHLTVSIYDVLKELHAEDPQKLEILTGLTGFMWGWAFNAVRYCQSEPPVPNPALMTIAT